MPDHDILADMRRVTYERRIARAVEELGSAADAAECLGFPDIAKMIRGICHRVFPTFMILPGKDAPCVGY